MLSSQAGPSSCSFVWWLRVDLNSKHCQWDCVSERIELHHIAATHLSPRAHKQNKRNTTHILWHNFGQMDGQLDDGLIWSDDHLCCYHCHPKWLRQTIVKIRETSDMNRQSRYFSFLDSEFVVEHSQVDVLKLIPTTSSIKWTNSVTPPPAGGFELVHLSLLESEPFSHILPLFGFTLINQSDMLPAKVLYYVVIDLYTHTKLHQRCCKLLHSMHW